MKSISGWVPAEIAERQANERSRPERDPDEAYDAKVARDMDAEREMSPIGKQIAETLILANETARIHGKIGRQQMARDVNAIIGTLAARKGPMEVINEIIALCKKEAA